MDLLRTAQPSSCILPEKKDADDVKERVKSESQPEEHKGREMVIFFGDMV